MLFKNSYGLFTEIGLTSFLNGYHVFRKQAELGRAGFPMDVRVCEIVSGKSTF